jgi:hypothetical protein
MNEDNKKSRVERPSVIKCMRRELPDISAGGHRPIRRFNHFNLSTLTPRLSALAFRHVYSRVSRANRVLVNRTFYFAHKNCAPRTPQPVSIPRILRTQLRYQQGLAHFLPLKLYHEKIKFRHLNGTETAQFCRSLHTRHSTLGTRLFPIPLIIIPLPMSHSLNPTKTLKIQTVSKKGRYTVQFGTV